MKTFILLTKLSPETSKQMKDRERLGRNCCKGFDDKPFERCISIGEFVYNTL